MAKRRHRWSIGNLIAPPRFILFVLASAGAIYYAIPLLDIRFGLMAGFDAGALFFFLICLPLLGHKSEHMRISACRNDANRVGLLLITGAVSLVILVAIASVLMQRSASGALLGLIVATLAIAWLFSNVIYALHYAHLFYSEGEKGDAGGLLFPETPEPDYWDFL
jgi:uncharacterized membrane protein